MGGSAGKIPEMFYLETKKLGKNLSKLSGSRLIFGKLAHASLGIMNKTKDLFDFTIFRKNFTRRPLFQDTIIM